MYRIADIQQQQQQHDEELPYPSSDVLLFSSRGLSNLSNDGRAYDDDASITTDTGVKLSAELIITLPIILFILLCICIFVIWKQHTKSNTQKNIPTDFESSKMETQSLEEQEKSEDSIGRQRIVLEVLFPVQGDSSNHKVRVATNFSTRNTIIIFVHDNYEFNQLIFFFSLFFRKTNVITLKEGNLEDLTTTIRSQEHSLTSISRFSTNNTDVDVQCPICVEDVGKLSMHASFIFVVIVIVAKKCSYIITAPSPYIYIYTISH